MASPRQRIGRVGGGIEYRMPADTQLPPAVAASSLLAIIVMFLVQSHGRFTRVPLILLARLCWAASGRPPATGMKNNAEILGF